ncbi:hypothetical protein TRVL_04158 [Trypanosoma vivax]|nr:hypothetical protein TRVL_04158 [Trypanosoma vivax]
MSPPPSPKTALTLHAAKNNRRIRQTPIQQRSPRRLTSRARARFCAASRGKAAAPTTPPPPDPRSLPSASSHQGLYLHFCPHSAALLVWLLVHHVAHMACSIRSLFLVKCAPARHLGPATKSCHWRNQLRFFLLCGLRPCVRVSAHSPRTTYQLSGHKRMLLISRRGSYSGSPLWSFARRFSLVTSAFTCAVLFFGWCRSPTASTPLFPRPPIPALHLGTFMSVLFFAPQSECQEVRTRRSSNHRAFFLGIVQAIEGTAHSSLLSRRLSGRKRIQFVVFPRATQKSTTTQSMFTSAVSSVSVQPSCEQRKNFCLNFGYPLAAAMQEESRKTAHLACAFSVNTLPGVPGACWAAPAAHLLAPAPTIEQSK